MIKKKKTIRISKRSFSIASKQNFYFDYLNKMLEQGYCFMPNEVLYNTGLTDKQKLLFCAISNLCAEKWYCRASNEYLWEKLNADARTIRRNISALQEGWFITITVKNNNQREISLKEGEDKNVLGVGQKCPRGEDKNVHIILQENNTIEKKENKEKFETFWKEYPHARKGKKKESEEYFSKLNPEEVMKQVSILKRKIKAWLQDWQYIPACERWIRDFTPISEDVINQDLVKICKRHLNTDWDMKQRASELKQTFWDEQINRIVKAIQQKDSPKNLFLKQN